MNRTKLIILSTVAAFLFTACPKNQKTNDVKEEPKPKKVEFMGETKKVDNRLDISVFSVVKNVAALGSLKLHMAPNKEDKLSVSLDVNSPKDVKPGTNANSSVWISLLNSSLLVGKEVGKFEVKISGNWGFDVSGSQASIASSMMAAMTNAKIKLTSVVVGTINPDGTIGPVSNLPAKLKAAIDAGKKTFGYPAGQVSAWDNSIKNYTDIRAMAKKGGIKLVELTTLYEAFKVITGSVVDLPKLVSLDEMKLSKELNGQLTGMSSNWHKIHKDYSKKYKKVYGKAKKDTKKSKKVADQYIKSSKELIKKGEVSPAYDYAQRGGAFAFTSYWSKRFDRLEKKKNLKGMLLAMVEFKEVSKKLNASVKVFKDVKPESRGDLLALVSAWEQLVSAWAYGKHGEDVAKETLDKINYLIKKKLAPSMDKDRLYKMLNNTTFNFSMASLKTQKAKDFSKFVGVKGAKFIVRLDKFTKIAALLKAVAVSSMANIDTLFVKNDAAKTGAGKDKIQKVLMGTNNNYLQAKLILDFPKIAANDGSFESSLASIAAYSASLFNSSMLYLKYISLEIRKDAKGEKDIKKKKVLEAMLIAAEKNVLQQAALSKKYSGVIPASAKFYFNIGLSMKDQNYALKVKSLEMFWKASLECQLSVLMAQ
jgi:uncharacterized protein